MPSNVTRIRPANGIAVTWMLSRDAIPNGNWTDWDLTALHDDQIIGRVYHIDHGPNEGLWFWAIFPGGDFNGPTSGRERSRGRAGHRVLVAYEQLLQSRQSRVA